jgi:hypothetical protein
MVHHVADGLRSTPRRPSPCPASMLPLPRREVFGGFGSSWKWVCAHHPCPAYVAPVPHPCRLFHPAPRQQSASSSSKSGRRRRRRRHGRRRRRRLTSQPCFLRTVKRTYLQLRQYTLKGFRAVRWHSGCTRAFVLNERSWNRSTGGGGYGVERQAVPGRYRVKICDAGLVRCGCFVLLSQVPGCQGSGSQAQSKEGCHAVVPAVLLCVAVITWASGRQGWSRAVGKRPLWVQ